MDSGIIRGIFGASAGKYYIPESLWHSIAMTSGCPDDKQPGMWQSILPERFLASSKIERLSLKIFQCSREIGIIFFLALKEKNCGLKIS